MASLRRKQIRSHADDEEFLSTVQSLHFEICKLQMENRELGERSTQLDQQPLRKARRPADSPHENISRPMFQSPQFRTQTNLFLASIGVEESSQRLRDALSRLRWKLVRDDSDESSSEEEDEEEAEEEETVAVAVAEVTSQETEVVGDLQEAPKDAEAQPGSDHEAAAEKSQRKINGCFAALWGCTRE
ncbi:coiled-coil domain-containing protein 9-like [Alosa sapidissima]|uniref:coiled-coil domain-containing protein 9-like n=1 Tax=Alosa sapidissima TaxID=34773 RepID=UPI001C09DDA8|nr:coiled-coil domain-containing protein 9-like [Alosa sapidissima]